jgi:tetratricopeptide (TPR) repeat protein
MSNYSNRREREEMQELLKVYHGLRSGRHQTFLEEEDFERLIDHFDDKDELKQALEAAESGLTQFPFSSVLMLKKADLLLCCKQYQDALDLIEQAEPFCPNDPTILVLKTDAFLALEQPEAAALALEQAVTQFEGDEKLELLFELCEVYDDYEDFERVFDCLVHILTEDPCNEEALLKICFWADHTGRCEESIKLHQRIIEDFPFCELAWFNLATAFQGLKLYEKAIDAYQFALAIDEKLDIAYRNMGDAHIRLRQYRLAIENLEKVLELGRPEDVIHEAIGHCHHKLEEFAEARAHYRKASQLNSNDSRIYYKIAITYCKETRWEQAIKQLEVAMRMHRLQPEYNLLMGECKMEQGKLKEAIQFFSNVVRVRPKNVSGRQSLICCLIKAEFFDEALEQAQHALQATNGKPLFEFYAAASCFLLGHSKQALAYLDSGLKKNHKDFRKILSLVPGLLHRPQVLDIINRHIKAKKTGSNYQARRLPGLG